MNLSTQQTFFNHIKQLLPAHLSLVDEIADLLNISIDSAYRRIRGEKHIDFEEIQKLAAHYKISLDQFLHLSSNAILFTDRSVNANSSFNFELYLKAVIQDLLYMNSFEEKTLYYLNKDVPIFHHFSFPQLAAFKCFFWRRSIVHDPVFSGQKFSLQNHVHQFEEASKKITDLYATIPSVEIWNSESINSTIRQIEYYRDTQVFQNKEDIKIVYESLLKAIERIELLAEMGCKQKVSNGTSREASYQVYVNEFILGDNTIMVHLNGKKLVYINHAVHNYMLTQDEGFCEFTNDHFINIIKKSTPVSAVNEKERKKFFHRNKEKINNRLYTL